MPRIDPVSAHISFQVTKTEQQALDRLALSEARNRSQMARLLVRRGLEAAGLLVPVTLRPVETER